jgi:hypothetical protein
MGSRVMWSRTVAHPPSYPEGFSNRCAGNRKIKCFVNKAFHVVQAGEQMTKIMYFLLTQRFLPRKPSTSPSVGHYFRA